MPNFYHQKETEYQGWTFVYLGASTYLIYYGPLDSAHTFTLTGGDDDLELRTEFPFRLNTLEMDFDDATVKDITMFMQRRRVADRTYPPEMKKEDLNIETNMIWYFNQNDKFDAGDKVVLRITGTATKVVCPIYKIQRLMK